MKFTTRISMPVKLKNNVSANQIPTAVDKEITRRLRIQNKKLLEHVASLKGQLKQLKADRNEIQNKLNHVNMLNNSLARATGSCSNCWGEDSNCIDCAGNGSPGWRDINKRLFNIYILPALEKLYHLSENIK
jgi:hypothetical protein